MPPSDLSRLGAPAPGGFLELPVTAVTSAGPGVRLVDVREPDERRGGFVPGSEHVPLAQVEEAAAGWPRDGELVLICRSGRRSARAAELLVVLGFGRVLNLAGGMVAYEAAGLPVARP
jgi:rhodanese-related sulfurtransferase